MKFFTPNLYERFNSENDEIANQANDDWDKADEDYRKHVDNIKNIPETLKYLNLHDKEITIENNDDDVTLTFHDGLILKYKLCDKFNINDKMADKINGPYSEQHVAVLYDEIHNHTNGLIHEIFLSNGNILEIPFNNFNDNIRSNINDNNEETLLTDNEEFQKLPYSEQDKIMIDAAKNLVKYLNNPNVTFATGTNFRKPHGIQIFVTEYNMNIPYNFQGFKVYVEVDKERKIHR